MIVMPCCVTAFVCCGLEEYLHCATWVGVLTEAADSRHPVLPPGHDLSFGCARSLKFSVISGEYDSMLVSFCILLNPTTSLTLRKLGRTVKRFHSSCQLCSVGLFGLSVRLHRHNVKHRQVMLRNSSHDLPCSFSRR